MVRYAIFTAMALLSAVTTVYAGPPASTATAKAVDPRDQIVCRRFARTGSLADTTRVCKTRREWDRDAENIRAPGAGVDSCNARANGGQC
jgi:hypothetical protein